MARVTGGVRWWLMLLLLAQGCYTTRVYVAPDGRPSGEVHAQWLWNLAWGFWTVNDAHVGRSCPAGVHSVTAELGVIGLVLTSVTGGFVTPITVHWTCNRPGETV